MDFCKLPLEIRRIIYRETCPVTLHFPVRVQTDMPLAATSHQIRSEYLSEIVRIPTSFIVHAHTGNTIDDFLDWIRPKTPHTLPHLSRLAVKASSLNLGMIASCKIQEFLEINDPAHRLTSGVTIDYRQDATFTTSDLTLSSSICPGNCHICKNGAATDSA